MLHCRHTAEGACIEAWRLLTFWGLHCLFARRQGDDDTRRATQFTRRRQQHAPSEYIPHNIGYHYLLHASCLHHTLPSPAHHQVHMLSIATLTAAVLQRISSLPSVVAQSAYRLISAHAVHLHSGQLMSSFCLRDPCLACPFDLIRCAVAVLE
ncbi:hypothetical protein GGR57DRAFT_319004 [Xylariaceae sp. FL1272]|nr:hypothetical protein GGR57DRAFT_319004 [Xylariaceae sp. FL1272]